MLAPSATGFLLISLSLDRYFAVVKPLSFYLSNNYVHKQTLLSWLIAAILSIPQFVGTGVNPDSGVCDVAESWTKSWRFPTYLSLVIFLIFIIPLVVSLVCYSKIVFRLAEKAEEYAKHKEINPSFVVSHKRLQNARKKATLMTVCVITCYFVCWGPYFCAAFVDCWFNVHLPSAVWTIVKNMVYFNSICNPIIYGLFAIRRSERTLESVCACCPAFIKTYKVFSQHKCSQCRTGHAEHEPDRVIDIGKQQFSALSTSKPTVITMTSKLSIVPPSDS